jgi:hypothetical protein
MRMRATSAIQIAICVLPAGAWSQTPQAEKKLTAREMFYAAKEEAIKPRPRPEPRPSPDPKREGKRGDGPAVTPPPPLEGKFIEVVNPPPLGLRYSVLKRIGNQTTEVSPDSVFHTGDRIQLGIDVSDTGYLYIVNQDSNGTWKVLFPSPEIARGDNRVDGGHNYVVPQGHVITVVGNPGAEKLFVILSRQPEQAMDQLIYSIQRGDQAPAAQPQKGNQSLPVLRADVSPVDNTLVDKFRGLYSRDLIIENEAGSEEQGKRSDKAVYVVNPSGESDSRVVADIRLNHQ